MQRTGDLIKLSLGEIALWKLAAALGWQHGNALVSGKLRNSWYLEAVRCVWWADCCQQSPPRRGLAVPSAGVRTNCKQGLCSWLDVPKLGCIGYNCFLIYFFFPDRLTSETWKPNSELKSSCPFFLQVQRKMTMLLNPIHFSSGWMFLPPGSSAFPQARNLATFLGAR